MQLLVLGFDNPQSSSESRAELDRLRDAAAVRLLDLVLIQTDAEGDVVLLEIPGLPGGDDGAAVAALIGLAQAETQAAVSDGAGLAGAVGETTWTVDDLLPRNTVAAVALVEHRWASGLRGAIERANGELLRDAWIRPDDPP